MCACAVVMMVAAISGAALIDPPNPNKSTPQDQNPKDNGFIAPNRRSKSRQVPSRYMSLSSSSSSATPKRCPSPIVSRNSTMSSNNARSVSVDRRRPLPLRPDLNPKLMKNVTEMSAAAKILVSSTRRLSVSFQGESYSFPVSKTKAAPQPLSLNLGSVRMGTPERRGNNSSVRGKVDNNGDQVEYSKPIDQRRSSAGIRKSNTLSRSLDYRAEGKQRLVGSDQVIRALQQSMMGDESRGASFDDRLDLSLGNAELLTVRELGLGGNLVDGSDSESVSLSSNSGVQSYGAVKPQGEAVSANSKVVDQHRWPARIRQSNTLSRNLDYSAEDKKRLGGSDKVVRALGQSMMADEGRRVSFDSRLGLNLGNAEPLKVRELGPSGSLANGSDSDSVSSGSTLSVQDCGAVKLHGVSVSVNSKPIYQHRWPARISQSNMLSRILDCSAKDQKKLDGSDKIFRALRQSMMADEGRRASFDGRLGLNLYNAELLKVRELGPHGISVNWSDSESVSFGSNFGVHDCGTVKPHGIAVSTRFWKETNSRLRRLQDSGSSLSTSPAKLSVLPKFGQLEKYLSDGVMSSPAKSGVRPSSPSKLMPSVVSSPSRGMTSPLRGMTSPSRARNLLSGLSERPSILNFPVDAQRGKIGKNQLVDAHLLRLLYNRHLQWRFVNARAESALLVQKCSEEKNLWNACITIYDLHDLLTEKRHRLQLLRQKLKLSSILKGQIKFLEDWASFERDYLFSLVGAIEALRASTLLCLPVVGGATADVQNVKQAIGSAVDIMQAMASSLSLLSSKAEDMNSLVIELAKVTTKESALLEQCMGFFSMLDSMQVKDCSLRTHIVQHNHVPMA